MNFEFIKETFDTIMIVITLFVLLIFIPKIRNILDETKDNNKKIKEVFTKSDKSNKTILEELYMAEQSAKKVRNFFKELESKRAIAEELAEAKYNKQYEREDK